MIELNLYRFRIGVYNGGKYLVRGGHGSGKSAGNYIPMLDDFNGIRFIPYILYLYYILMLMLLTMSMMLGIANIPQLCHLPQLAVHTLVQIHT